jgi:hypothetical protein
MLSDSDNNNKAINSNTMKNISTHYNTNNTNNQKRLESTSKPLFNAIPSQQSINNQSTANLIAMTLKSLFENSSKRQQLSNNLNSKPVIQNINASFPNQSEHPSCSSSSNEEDFDDAITNNALIHSSPSPLDNSFTTHTNEVLNTADIAQKVRDLLSLHNIGQRIFAKYILGLSQGTVSELLSKPKHWDKLTEKGRESYRKMFSWSCSEQSINALKAISPRKGNKDNYFYHSNHNTTSGQDDPCMFIYSNFSF